MLATKCSFCQHENSPGSRFCAKCGSPMHLKICPNPQCGKVSDVSAAVCESCGEAFPKIALAPVGADAPTESQQPDPAPPAAKEGKSRMPAWPLVMMAIVAGGLPLLWANRAQLPTPKTWQLDPDASPPKAAVSAQKPPAAATAAAPPLPPAPVQAAVLGSGDPVPASGADSASDSRTQAHQPASAKPAKKTTPKPRKKAEPPRPCTEAVAALGLCNPPKQAGK